MFDILYAITIAKSIDHIIECVWILKIKIAIQMNTISLLPALLCQVKQHNSYLQSHFKSWYKNVDVYSTILKRSHLCRWVIGYKTKASKEEVNTLMEMVQIYSTQLSTDASTIPNSIFGDRGSSPQTSADFKKLGRGC